MALFDSPKLFHSEEVGFRMYWNLFRHNGILISDKSSNLFIVCDLINSYWNSILISTQSSVFSPRETPVT